MVTTVKFSEFDDIDLAGTNLLVGLSEGLNAKSAFPLSWTTVLRPVNPTNGTLGYNTTLSLYEFWNGVTWIQLSTSSGSFLPLSGGTMTGPIILAADATLPLEPVTLQQLQAGYLPLSGGTMSGVINMGSFGITNLADPVNPQDAMTLHYAGLTYLPLTGGTMSGAINMGGFGITNLAQPVNPDDAVTKMYVDQTAMTGTSAYAATTTNLNVTQSGSGVGATLTDASGTFAAFTTDGVAVPLNSNVLVKNLAAPQHEGIYKLTTNGNGISIPYQLTRATSYDTPTEINNTGLIVVQNGSTLAGTAWYNVATIVVVDTTNFNYVEYGNILFPISVAHGGTGLSSTTINQLLYSSANNVIAGLATANNGLLTTNNSGVPSILAGSGITGNILQSNSAAAPSFSTATYPSTTTINQLLYSSANNVISGLSTVNSAGLLTNSSGVPGWVIATGTGAPVLANTPTLITPILGVATATSLKLPNSGQILDPNGNVYLTFISATSAINNIAISNSATTVSPTLSAVGIDTNVALTLNGQGTGGVAIQGTGTNNSANVGYIGEFQSASLAQGSATSLTNNVAKTIVTLSLTAGDWDVSGSFCISPAGTTITQLMATAISLTTNTFPATPDSSFNELAGVSTVAGAQVCIITGVARISLATTTSVFLIGFANFTVSTNTGFGIIRARRVR